MTKENSFILIGLGAVGRALAPALVKAGYVCRGLVGRGDEKALARRCKTPLMTSLDSLPDDFDLMFLCVRDNQIAQLAEELSQILSPPKAPPHKDTPPKSPPRAGGSIVVFHTAGALSSDVLAPLKEKGVEVASFHPFGSFPRAGKPPSFKGLTFGIEGTPTAQARAEQIARDLGGNPLIVPADKRAIYHLAAVFASNFFVGDLALATQMLAQLGLDEVQALRVLAPIVEGTFRNVKELGVKGALTGPAARGDNETLARHEDVLRKMNPELAELYRTFSEYLKKV
ncbi:DUF2520 domain-containing protein [bacterium]|nr:DUF2520 domain-containing protein [bacterium]